MKCCYISYLLILTQYVMQICCSTPEMSNNEDWFNFLFFNIFIIFAFIKPEWRCCKSEQKMYRALGKYSIPILNLFSASRKIQLEKELPAKGCLLNIKKSLCMPCIHKKFKKLNLKFYLIIGIMQRNFQSLPPLFLYQ